MSAAFSTTNAPPPPTRPVLRGVVFDMDGTLTVPNLDFAAMYQRCGVDPSDDLLAVIGALPPAEAAAAHAVIEEMEEEGRRTLRLAPGAVELGEWLRRHGVPMALVTRNTQRTVEHMTGTLWPHNNGIFSPVVSRDDPVGMPAKPDPAALDYIKEQWGYRDSGDGSKEQLLMVGDSPSNDVAFGKAAGVATALVDTGRRHTEGGTGADADLTVENLTELPRELWRRFRLDGPVGAVNLTKHARPTPTTPACRAAFHGDLDTLSRTLDDDDEELLHGRNTPLIWAADAGHTHVVETLLRRDPSDLNHQGVSGATAVSRACRRGHVGVLRSLLSHPSCDVDVPNDKLQYPLHFAAFQEHPEAVRLLLEYGANTRVLDRKGRTPAEDTQDKAIRDAILRARV